MSHQLALLQDDEPQRFPLTDFLVALIRMTPAERRAASPQLVADRYGIRLDWAEYYTQHWRGIS